MPYKEHSYIGRLRELFATGRIDRREFLRISTLLGLSASAAYAFVGRVGGTPLIKPASAALPMGGTVRIAMRVQEVVAPHGPGWPHSSNITRQVVEYLTKTDHENVTHPYL